MSGRGRLERRVDAGDPLRVGAGRGRWTAPIRHLVDVVLLLDPAIQVSGLDVRDEGLRPHLDDDRALQIEVLARHRDQVLGAERLHALEVDVVRARSAAQPGEGERPSHAALIGSRGEIALHDTPEGRAEFVLADRGRARLLDQVEDRSLRVLDAVGIHREREGDGAAVDLVFADGGGAGELGVPRVQARLGARGGAVDENGHEDVHGERVGAPPRRRGKAERDRGTVRLERIALDRAAGPLKSLLAEPGSRGHLAARHRGEGGPHLLDHVLRIDVTDHDHDEVLGDVAILVEALDQRRGHDGELVLAHRERGGERIALVEPRPHGVHRRPVRVRQDGAREALGSSQRAVDDDRVQASLGEPLREEVQPGPERAGGDCQIEVGIVVARVAREGARESVDLFLHRSRLAPFRPLHDALGRAHGEAVILGRLVTRARPDPGLDGDDGPGVDLADDDRDLVGQGPHQIRNRCGLVGWDDEKQGEERDRGVETHSVESLRERGKPG